MVVVNDYRPVCHRGNGQCCQENQSLETEIQQIVVLAVDRIHHKVMAIPFVVEIGENPKMAKMEAVLPENFERYIPLICTENIIKSGFT